MTEKFKIEFPKINAHNYDQDEEYFFLVEPDRREDRNKRKIHFHEYAKIIT